MRNQDKHKTGIRRKVTLMICLPALIILVIGIAFTYLFGFPVLRDNIGRQYEQITKMLANEIVTVFKGEIEDIQTYTTRPLWLDYVEESNLKYKGMEQVAILNRLKEMDKKWIEAGKDSLLLQDYLGNRIGVSISAILKLRPNVTELFITDRFGGLVAASNKTSDFYQADEEWWQKAYNSGKGSIYIGDIEFDESAGKWAIPVAIPIINRDNEIIGICKEVLAIEKLFGQLKDFKLGNTGHAAVIDNKGNVLFHHGMEPMSKRIFSDEDLQVLSSSKKQYFISMPHFDSGKMFVACSRIAPPFLSERGISWIIFIDEDAAEVFRPLNLFILHMGLMALLLVIIIIPLGYVFGSVFVNPIRQLHTATERIVEGDWDYEINVKTGDEIEQFADAFKEMITSIKEKQAQLLKAKQELEDLAGNLDKRVQERTQELNQVNEATLNILEDLTEAKNRLEGALKVKSDFTSMVSHELRTPLAAIKEGIAIVADQTAGTLNEKQGEFLGIAQRNVDRLTRIISEILDFQKLESGKMVFHMEENNINDAVREFANTISPLLKSRGLELELKLYDNLPVVRMDKDKIIRVLNNLVNNSLKATEKGSIIIATLPGDNFVRVSVQDTGAGIKDEDMPRLFQQFVQLENGPMRRPGGTGLGLVICKEIIEEHKGKIWAESAAGQGSTFHFILPVKERRS